MNPNSPCVFCHPELLDHPVEVQSYYPITVMRTKPRDPVTDGHTLFFGYQHLEDAGHDPVVTGMIMREASGYARKMHQYYNIITSAGEPATQSVWHLHIHVVPRREGDGLHLPWTGQKKG